MAELRAGAEHFVVEELPAYAPCGSGEHLYVWVEKRGLTTEAAARALARACDVSLRGVGYAGRKDRHARARQWFSLHGAQAQGLDALRDDPGLSVLDTSNHRNKLRLGHLRGNRFELRLGSVDPELGARLAALATHGVPNRFGPQRFGRAGANLAVARAWARGDLRTAVERIVDPAGAWKLGAEAPRHARASAAGSVLRALGRNADDLAAALRGIGRRARQWYASAAQSAVFNAVLDARRARGLLHQLRVGDVARTPRGALFVCGPDDLADANRRAAPGVLELAATGPLPGHAVLSPAPPVDAEERGWAAAIDLDLASFGEGGALESRGERRALVVPFLEPPRLRGDWLGFALPPGSYATQVLAELGVTFPEDRAKV